MKPEAAAAPRVTPALNLAEAIHERTPEILHQAASDRRLTEELALTLLERRDLPAQALEDLSRNGAAMKHRKVISALVMHPRTPRHVSLPIIRRLFSFELMAIALAPTVAADLKLFAEEQLISRLESVSAGERLSLAKRGSTRIAAALLLDPEARIIDAALENPRMTEMWIAKALMDEETASLPLLVLSVSHHLKWSLRREIRLALLKNEHTPLARAMIFADGMSSAALRDVLRKSRLPKNVKDYLLHLLETRKQKSSS